MSDAINDSRQNWSRVGDCRGGVWGCIISPLFIFLFAIPVSLGYSHATGLYHGHRTGKQPKAQACDWTGPWRRDKAVPGTG